MTKSVFCGSRRRRRPYLYRKRAIHRGRPNPAEAEDETAGAKASEEQPPNAFANRRDRRNKIKMSVWEQRANQLRRRRQMASREVLFDSPTEDPMGTPMSGHHQTHTLVPSAEASPAHLPESPMSVIMPLPEPPMSISIPLPEPPESEPVSLMGSGMEDRSSGTVHRSNTDRRHRVARKFRAAAAAGVVQGGRHRRHRHRESRTESKNTDEEQGPEGGDDGEASQSRQSLLTDDSEPIMSHQASLEQQRYITFWTLCNVKEHHV